MIKYIFSINTGRSGSHYLANMLSTFENIAAFHEPDPIMNGSVMLDFMKGNVSSMESATKNKLNVINAALDNKSCYIETNHTFIKGFGWFIPSMIPQEQLGIIELKRSKDEIVKSLYRVNCTPLTYTGHQWIMNPLMKDPLNPVLSSDKLKFRFLYAISVLLYNRFTRPTINFKKLNIIKEFELKYLDWYVEETYAQGDKFRKMYPGIKVFETSIDKLNSIQEFERMFDFFGLEFKTNDSFLNQISNKTNLKHSATNSVTP